MKKLMISMTLGTCCILSWVMAGMILNKEKDILATQDVAVQETLEEKDTKNEKEIIIKTNTATNTMEESL